LKEGVKVNITLNTTEEDVRKHLENLLLQVLISKVKRVIKALAPRREVLNEGF
jgi:hypothetical protein